MAALPSCVIQSEVVLVASCYSFPTSFELLPQTAYGHSNMTRPLAAGGFFLSRFHPIQKEPFELGKRTFSQLKPQVNRVPGSGFGIPRGGGRRKPHPANMKGQTRKPAVNSGKGSPEMPVKATGAHRRAPDSISTDILTCEGETRP